MALMTEPWTQDPLVRDDAALRALLDRLASTATDPVDPAVRAATLERVLAAAAEHARPEPVPTRRRRVRQVLAMTGAKVVVAAGVAAATTGGLAATGSLPDPAQGLVHDVGEAVGIGFPDAPGQVKPDGEPAHEHAPGRRAREDGDPGTTGRSYAPGQLGRDLQDPGLVVRPSPAQDSPKDTAPPETTRGREDPAVRPAAPDGPEVPAQEPAPPSSTDGSPPTPEAPAPPTDPATPPPAQDAPAANEPGSPEDGPGRSEDAPGRDGTPPTDRGAGERP